MPPTPRRTTISRIGIALILLLVNIGAPAETEEELARNQLQKLRQNMAALSQDLEEDILQRGSLRVALRKSELAIGKIRKDISATQDKQTWARSKLADLRSQREELLIARGEQQELIIHEIQTAYQMGKQGQLKVLLNQEKPDTLARSMAYYEYLYKARQQEIDRYLGTIERINLLEPEIADTANQLELTSATLTLQERQLLNSKQQRQLDLDNLEAEIVNKDQQLQKMDQDREELERLLEVIEQAIAEMEVPQELESFAELRGQMPWPVNGRASNRYGRKRGAGSQTWQGLNIPTQEGNDVIAIHHGRVVFADWFRGSGLLLIIDHGDGYMSLYAHNQALLRDVGEWVNAGAAIATAGNSGGRRNSALYFEIRENGKPVNPAHWLAKG